MKYNEKKLYKQLHKLMNTSIWYMSRARAEEISKQPFYHKSTIHEALRMIHAHKILDVLGFSENEREAYFTANRVYRIAVGNEYKKMPKRPRKDNKDYINYGSGGGNGGWLRYPKKCRKTAWKRFYKLFPHLLKKKE